MMALCVTILYYVGLLHNYITYSTYSIVLY